MLEALLSNTQLKLPKLRRGQDLGGQAEMKRNIHLSVGLICKFPFFKKTNKKKVSFCKNIRLLHLFRLL